MVMTDNEALNKISDQLKDIKKLLKGQYQDNAANEVLSKAE